MVIGSRDFSSAVSHVNYFFPDGVYHTQRSIAKAYNVKKMSVS